jgi:hypothetical protein
LDKPATYQMLYNASRLRQMSEEEIESRRQRIRMVIENQAVAKQNAMVMVPIINYVEVIPTPPSG